MAPPPRYLVLVLGDNGSASVDLLLQNVSTKDVTAIVPTTVQLDLPPEKSSHVRFMADGAMVQGRNVHREVPAEGTVTLSAFADAADFAMAEGEFSVRIRSSDSAIADHECTLFVSCEPPEPTWLGPNQQPITGTTLARMEVEISGPKTVGLESLRVKTQLRNTGASALVAERIEVGGGHERWLQLLIPPGLAIRHNETRACEVVVLTHHMPAGFSGTVPITIHFAGIPEPAIVHVEVITLRPPSLVISLPGFTQQGPETFVLNNCSPYGQQDFEVCLTNNGDRPVEVTEVFVEGGHIQLFQGGYNPVQTGKFTLHIHPGSPDNSLSLNIDMERLRHGVTHAIQLRIHYEGRPSTSEAPLIATAHLELKPKRKQLNFATNARSYVGIDFGTSNSCVAVNQQIQVNVPEDQFQLVPLSDRGQLAGAASDDPYLLPSVIFFRDVEHPIIGRLAKSIEAKQFERKRFRSFKRTIGVTVDQYVDGTTLSPEDLAEIIFGCLIDTAIQRLPDFPARIVATCPANFYHFQRMATLRACRRAMLRKLLLAHADELRELERLTKMLATQAHGSGFQEFLDATPEARRLVEDARNRFAEYRPDISWDSKRTSDCLLLLLFLTTSRRELMDFSSTPSIAGRRVHGARFSEALTRAMFGQLWRPDVLGPPRGTASSPGLNHHAPDGRDAVDLFEDSAAHALQKLLGTNVLILDEPSAAAYAYVLHEVDRIEDLPDGESEFVAVYDLGGGTFDISIMAIRKDGNHSRVEVIHTDGVNELGGDDLDFAIGCLLMDRMKLASTEDVGLMKTSILELDAALASVNASRGRGDDIRKLKNELKRKAEELKIAFSDDPSLGQIQDERLTVPQGIAVEKDRLTVTRDEVMSKVRQKIQDSVDKTVDVVEHARKKVEDRGEMFRLKYLILAGKASRLPLVKEMLLKEPRLSLQPEQLYPGFGKMEKACVARGATYYGHLMADGGQGQVHGGPHPLSHSVGVVESTGLSDRFSAIPGLEKGAPMTDGVLSGVLRYSWVPNGRVPLAQNAGTVRRVLGNRDIVNVGTFVWTIPFKAPQQDVKVEVTVTVDQNGLVSAAGMYGTEPVGGFHPTPVGLMQVKPFIFA